MKIQTGIIMGNFPFSLPGAWIAGSSVSGVSVLRRFLCNLEPHY